MIKTKEGELLKQIYLVCLHHVFELEGVKIGMSPKFAHQLSQEIYVKINPLVWPESGPVSS